MSARGYVAWLGVLAATLGCAQESGSASRAEAPLENATVLAIDERLEAHALRVDDTLLLVELRGLSGALLFEAQYQRLGLGDYHLAYTLHALYETEPLDEPVSAALPLDDMHALSLDEAVRGAVLVHAQLESGLLGEYDSWGCDLLPGRFNWVGSCGSKGGCCDAHDACYKENNCRAWSFASAPWTRCQLRCNAPVVSCFLSQDPGPSECCALGNCGRPR